MTAARRQRQTWTGDWRIPKTVVLPGVRVQVRVVTEADRGVLQECDGLAIYSYDQQTCVILIDGRLPLPVQRYTLLHELEHVQNELRDIMLENFPYDVCTRYMWDQHEAHTERVTAKDVAS